MGTSPAAFIDTNVQICAAGPDHPLKEGSAKLLQSPGGARLGFRPDRPYLDCEFSNVLLSASYLSRPPSTRLSALVVATPGMNGPSREANRFPQRLKKGKRTANQT